MGNRANIVVVNKGEWELRYSHWAGCRMLDMLVCGPAYAKRYLKGLEVLPKDHWTCPEWADGGAVFDWDQKRVLFFGDEIMMEMPLRRAMLAVVRKLWRGYSIEWAYDGTVELAAYVGGVKLGDMYWDRKPKLILAKNRNSLCHLISVVGADENLRFWPVCWHMSKAWLGPAMLDMLPGRGIKKITLGMIPEGGVHIDVPRKTVGAWQTNDTLGLFSQLPEIWDGWRTETWADRYEEHVARCAGALVVPDLDLAYGAEEAAKHITKRVFQSYADSPEGMFAGLATALGAAESDIDQLNGRAGQPTEREWARFTTACAALGLQNR